MGKARKAAPTAKAGKGAKGSKGMTNKTAIVVIAACVVVAGLVFALTTAPSSGSGTAVAGTQTIASLGTGKPAVYEFSTDS